jgi:hypothetical protein
MSNIATPMGLCKQKLGLGKHIFARLGTLLLKMQENFHRSRECDNGQEKAVLFHNVCLNAREQNPKIGHENQGLRWAVRDPAPGFFLWPRSL